MKWILYNDGNGVSRVLARLTVLYENHCRIVFKDVFNLSLPNNAIQG